MNEPTAVQPYVNQAFIRRVSFIAGLGGILYGFDMGVIAAALIYVRDSFHLSTVMQEVLVIAVLIGVMIGALIGGTVADRIGRRKTLMWGAVLFIAGFHTCALVAQCLRAVCCPRAAGDRRGVYFGHGACIRVRACSSEVARHADRVIPIRSHPGYRAGRPGGLLVCRIAGMAMDVCVSADSRSSFPLHGSHCAGESALAVRAEQVG